MMICALLLFRGICQVPSEATELFNKMRVRKGRGLTIPSQIRYVDYIHRILTSPTGCALPEPKG